MTKITLYGSEWEEIDRDSFFNEKDTLKIQWDSEGLNIIELRYYKKIESLEEVESSSLKGESIPDISLGTKSIEQNRSHDLHASFKSDNRLETDVGNSQEMNKSPDSSSEGESDSGEVSLVTIKNSKTPSTKPAPSETFVLSEFRENTFKGVSYPEEKVKEAVKILKEEIERQNREVFDYDNNYPDKVNLDMIDIWNIIDKNFGEMLI